MINILQHKYLIFRRTVQLGLLVLFAGSNYLGWQILKGNYSAALLFDALPLSDPYATLQIVSGGAIPGITILIGALIVLLFYTLIAGRMFCSWVCPMNIVSDIALWLSRKLGISSTLQPNRSVRYYALGLGFILSFILGYAAFEAISPISLLHRGIIFGLGSAWFIIAAIFLIELAFAKNIWCGYLCPLGAFYAITGRLSLLKINHKVDNCTSCMKCFKVCPEEHVLSNVTKNSGIIKSSECTNCARCIDVCEDNALLFSIRNLQSKKQSE